MMLVFCLLAIIERRKERESSPAPDPPGGQTVMVDFTHKKLVI